MISSTARDLPEHREQVRRACEQAGFAPHDMMEHLTALNADAIAASLRMVENAEVYIGIFANRYGSVPSGHKISITEMEYDRAVTLTKKRLIFFSHADHPFKEQDFETGPGARKLKALKRRIAKTRVAAYFKSADDLRGHVVAALWKLREELDAAATEATAQAVVAKLDRQGELAKAAEAGVGERAMLELARQLKPHEELTLDQAVVEVSAAVKRAIDVIRKGKRGSNLDDIVDMVRARIAEKTGAGDLDGAAREADRGVAEWSVPKPSAATPRRAAASPCWRPHWNRISCGATGRPPRGGWRRSSRSNIPTMPLPVSPRYLSGKTHFISAGKTRGSTSILWLPSRSPGLR
jgi:hypothetical protein